MERSPIRSEDLVLRLCRRDSAERPCLSVCSTLRFHPGSASEWARRSLARLFMGIRPERQSLSALCCGRAAIFVLLLLTAHCTLLTVLAQPGVPQPNSPLYGGGGNSGQASTGLPPVLKKVGIDQHLNE